ncbi:MAG: hypothetical protein WBN83_12410, partial [Desulfoprunum sp.]|uniref:hypothetical protein n=1 Tax=Desulfoprunum sp. TaxID=2020866 RepID=UPI003C736BC4
HRSGTVGSGAEPSGLPFTSEKEVMDVDGKKTLPRGVLPPAAYEKTQDSTTTTGVKHQADLAIPINFSEVR